MFATFLVAAAALAIIWFYRAKRQCPDCGEVMEDAGEGNGADLAVSRGGGVCPACGCVVNSRGEVIERRTGSHS